MEEDYEEEGHDSNGIRKPMSAYHQYSKENSSKVRDEMVKEGKATALGAIVSVVAARWHALSDDEKAIYEEMALEDRQRYNRECAIRDEEFLRQQEERREANTMTETETRMRNSTIASTDASTVKHDAPKRKREVSESEKQERDQRRQAKAAEEKAISDQHKDLKALRAAQAEARLKYLLSQSDIFSHFGQGKSKPPTEEETAAAAAAAPARGRRGRAPSKKAAAFDELDDDERAIVEEAGEGDDDEGAAKAHSTILVAQPRLISGGELRPYQLEGLNWMIRLRENGINGILADEMGLGKTLQSISILAYMKEFVKISGPHLVMVPKSTLSNWMNEFARWAPTLRTIRFHGNKDERLEIVQNVLRASATQDQRSWDVVITTYEVVNMEKSALAKIAWRYLIIDEAHRLKNEDSQFAQTVRMLDTQHRLLLTGTPLQNNLHELWALLNFLLPDVFASAEQFDEWFNLDVDDTEAKQRIIQQLHKILRPFMLRRLKVDVEKSLPPKSETILFTGMSSTQKNLYRQILLRDIDTVNSGGSSGGSGSRTAILNIVMQLRKCCNHPYLFPGVEDRTQDPMGEHLYTSCGKMVLLDKLLAKMKERDHRVLIFSQMTRMLDILEDYLISRGYLYCRIDGNTSYDDREDRIADFNRPGSDKFVFLLSTRAGGLGINLQTADTVILYDSDWNPQADLQAQDRAHRIGQKKPVQVFRLITDESVEVKVVERAQQKLKLDAMVVQQGRLQDKDKKLSKQDLLDTVRFGADKIFRSKDSTISDDDIDVILEQGRKRTEEMNEKLVEAQKGDLYDFSLDGGMNTQVFEGKDYADRSMREKEAAVAVGHPLLFIDPGKRERKAVATYSESLARSAMEESTDKRPKIPRHLRLVKMEDWQFYDKERLTELHAEELRLFDELVDRGEAPQSGSIHKLVVLPPEQHEEKVRLLAEAFSDWTKVHYNNFIRASARHGRKSHEKIAKDVGRPTEEVRRYAEAFWQKGERVLQPAEWERVVKQIEKGEKRLEEIQRLTSATAKLIMMFNDPWEELTFRNVGNQGRIFNAVEDRFLLCLTHLHGYGSWDQVRSSIRRCERFRFDFYLQSCSAEALGKRCEMLMRAAERELAEIERKKQAADAMTATNSRPKDSTELNKTRMDALMKEIKAESARLAQIRVQLQKTKNGRAAIRPGEKAGGDGAAGGAAAIKKPAASKLSGASSGSSAPAAAVSKAGGKQLYVPDGYLPELCKLLKKAGPDGVSKVVTQFTANHPNISKRQTEIKIGEIAVKEKRGNDTKLMWHILPAYEHFLEMDNFDSSDPPAVEGGARKSFSAAAGASDDNKAKGKSANKRKLDDTERVPAAKTPSSSSGAKGSMSASVSKATSSKPAVTKTPSSAMTISSQPQTLSEPKKFKRAFAWFVKEKRCEAEGTMKDPTDTEALKNRLKEWWDKIDTAERKHYQNKESEDKERYEREMDEYTAQQAEAQTKPQSSKKKKA